MSRSQLQLERLQRLDALRGLSMLWMAVFHGCFDLNQAGRIQPPQNFYLDPFWTWQRTAIVSLFLFCAGVSQALAQARGQTTSRFRRRWLQIAGCAVLVSIASAWMFPGSWISFGILHGIAVMLVLLHLSRPLATRNMLLLAALCMALPQLVQHPIFDTRWTNWIGLVTHKPVTEDYVPLLPWFGVMLLGACAGRWALRRQLLLSGPLPASLQPLAWLGRWPLSFYMLHQPLILGALWLSSS